MTNLSCACANIHATDNWDCAVLATEEDGLCDNCRAIRRSMIRNGVPYPR